MKNWLRKVLGLGGAPYEPFPQFRYHPDPIKTGSIIVDEDTVCPCCERRRGFVYTGSFYSERDVDGLCPWCIASGAAAKKFDGSFSDDHPLGGIDPKISDEVSLRTPGYSSFQQESWLVCCGDACEYHGIGTLDDLNALDPESLERFMDEMGVEESLLEIIREGYVPGESDMALYKFVCRHCGKVRLGMDLL